MLIWWLGGKPLSKQAEVAVSDERNEVLVSAASVWEAEIKAADGKLDLRGDLREGIRDSGFAQLAIDFAHAVTAARLPRHHRDPFDRMLIAQARCERLTLVTRDARLAAYEVDLLAA